MRSRQVCAELGITYRQLTYWCMAGYVAGQEDHPSSGIPRIFTEEQINRLKFIRDTMAEIERLKALIVPEATPKIRETRRTAGSMEDAAYLLRRPA